MHFHQTRLPPSSLVWMTHASLFRGPSLSRSMFKSRYTKFESVYRTHQTKSFPQTEAHSRSAVLNTGPPSACPSARCPSGGWAKKAILSARPQRQRASRDTTDSTTRIASLVRRVNTLTRKPELQLRVRHVASASTRLKKDSVNALDAEATRLLWNVVAKHARPVQPAQHATRPL